ncbi:MAG TPA: lyase family protein [Methylomirabilota bacterium]|nr:lyase family protein [Methylomirabilota bacterium]
MNLVARSFARETFTRALAGEALVAAMLEFERALADAEAGAGVIPAEAARVIGRVCAELRLAPEALADEARRSGSLAVPLVKALTDHVARADAGAAAFVHYGSTSQDVLDTALVLCLEPCLTDAERVLAAAVTGLTAHARRHAGAVMLGRTLLQPATPITAGLKIARWAVALHRCRLRLGETRDRALCIQLGGAVGTLEALGGARAAVRRGLAKRLGLAEAREWHTQRDELLRLMAELAIVTTTIGKIAGDVALLAQAEVGEMLEAAPVKGVGSSSAMPHKRNPVACLQALTAAARVPGLMATLLAGAAGEHERALGGWQAELVTIPELLDAAGGALDALERISRGLVVNTERMRANLDALHGLVFAERLARRLAREMDRAAAQTLVDEWSALAVRDRRQLRDVARSARPALADQLDAVFSLDAIVAELAPVLDETLAAIER